MVKKIECIIFDGEREIAREKLIFINEELYEPDGIPKSLIKECAKINENNKEIEITDKIFGERNEKLVEIFRTSELDINESDLSVGKYVKIGNYFGIIKSVSGGRVQIDFNHPYAGKILKAKLILEKILTDKKEILEEILNIKNIREDVEKFEIENSLLKIELKTQRNLEITKEFLNKIKAALGLEKIKIVLNY